MKLIGELNPAWKGGRRIAAKGYAHVLLPGHHRARSNGYVPESIIVVERAMGKPLSGNHPIHHVNEVKDDNRNQNLVVCEDQGYHRLLHTRLAALRACGDPSWRKCHFCHQWDALANMHHRSSGKRNPNVYSHVECAKSARRIRYSASRRSIA